MTDKERAVIEAAYYEGYADGSGESYQKYGGECHDAWRRSSAKNTLDAEQAEPDYKWLAMDGGGSCWAGYDEKPVFETIWIGSCHDVGEKPTFLKPGQLWERDEKARPGLSTTEPSRYSHWNGYWWRLIEDHGDKEQPESAWITDRRPTEEDADKNGRVMVYVVNRTHRVVFRRWDCDTSRNNPWQPVPQCLRTPPEEPKCEDCVHYTVFIKRGDNRDKRYLCAAKDSFNFVVGGDDCEYQTINP